MTELTMCRYLTPKSHKAEDDRRLHINGKRYYTKDKEEEGFPARCKEPVPLHIGILLAAI